MNLDVEVSTILQQLGQVVNGGFGRNDEGPVGCELSLGGVPEKAEYASLLLPSAPGRQSLMSRRDRRLIGL